MTCLIEVQNLKKHFPVREPLLARLLREERKFVHAVDGVTFAIREGDTFSLVGESGCGKTTCGKLILCLFPPTSGTVLYRGVDLFNLKHEKMKELRSKMQPVFQNTLAALNPRKNVKDLLGKPLRIHNLCDRSEIEDRVSRLLELVGLSPVEQFIDRYPHELSGGQRQRVCIARAMAVKPEFLVLDEPTSALDVSLRASILEMLKTFKREMRLTALFITHDLAMVRSISNIVAVMYMGQIVELADVTALFSNPMHPYTKSLLSATPIPDPYRSRARTRVILKGDVPSPIDPPSGCRFRTRCLDCTEDCAKVDPKLLEVADGHSVACINFK